ncbi:extracellular solute-binding protein [Ancylobacter amanitiformis]|uniref:Multiple sugar transport system substrate-binding protein n=1 Tax=Ancylobacter amanitiformis TaxID=217069 RepID=A0ABU0LN43_9HYPH|nr:extracellular solute-binding protein [Ancylobacter amanitiformis]MDQ0510106.1 multiple sugar transport system substrate-binding protein [Ancylobacter amanitiformis]
MKRKIWCFAAALAATTALSASALHPAMAQDASFYAEAAKPYKGTTIRVLDEITPLQETLSKIVPDFEKETGIKVEWELLNHFEVINKGQADMLSGRGYYDAIMLHGSQLGPMLSAGVIAPIDAYVANAKLADPAMNDHDFIQTPYKTTAFSGGKQYGFINWNYNHVYWARADLLNNPEEQAAFKAKYGYDLAPAKTIEQMRDIAQFFTRKKGALLAGKPLESDFYGIVLEGIKGGSTFSNLWVNFIQNYGGDVLDKDGKPVFDSPQTVAALTMWRELWTYAPPGIAEYSLVDVPTVMGNGIAAQSLAWSDFVLGIDKPGVSPYAGKFVYAPVPAKAGNEAKRHADAEPSVTVISAASKNPEATFLFLEWLASKRQQDKLIEMGQGGVPIRESSWALPAIKDASNSTLFAAMKSSLAVASARPKMEKYPEMFDAMSGIAQQVGLGKMTPEEGAKQGQAILVKLCGGKSCTI